CLPILFFETNFTTKLTSLSAPLYGLSATTLAVSGENFMDTVGILTLSSAPEIPLAIGRNGFHRSPVDTSVVCFDFDGLQTKFFGSSGIVVAPTMFSNMSFCLRGNVEGSCTEHSLSSITSRSAASVSDLIQIRVRQSVAERDFAVYTKVLASFDISDVHLPSDLLTLVKPKFCGKCLAPRIVTFSVLSFGECVILMPISGSRFTVRSNGVDTVFRLLSIKFLIFASAMFAQLSSRNYGFPITAYRQSKWFR
ncbi:hypothetical protein ALC53_10524, partial [Atta colombica]